MSEINFTIYGKPKAKGRPRVMKSGYTFTPKATVEYENLVKLSYLQSVGKVDPFDGPLIVEIDFFFEIPKSYSKKRKTNILTKRELYTKKPDIDNLIKSITDGLNEVAFNDDKQIVTITARKHYTTETQRAEVLIKEIETNILE